MTGLPDPAPFPIDHVLIIRHRRVHDLYPFPDAKLAESRNLQGGGGTNVYTGFI